MKAPVLHPQVPPYRGTRLAWSSLARNSQADQLLQDAQALSEGVSKLNTHRIAKVERRVNAFASLVLALAIGIGMGYVLLCFGTPCEGASLCMAAVLPTHRSWLQRLVLDFQAWRLRRAIRHAQHALADQHEALDLARWECEHLPLQLAVTRAHIDNLAHQLGLVQGTAGR